MDNLLNEAGINRLDPAIDTRGARKWRGCNAVAKDAVLVEDFFKGWNEGENTNLAGNGFLMGKNTIGGRGDPVTTRGSNRSHASNNRYAGGLGVG